MEVVDTLAGQPLIRAFQEARFCPNRASEDYCRVGPPSIGASYNKFDCLELAVVPMDVSCCAVSKRLGFVSILANLLFFGMSEEAGSSRVEPTASEAVSSCAWSTLVCFCEGHQAQTLTALQ